LQNFSYKVSLIDDSEDQDILSVIDDLHTWIDSCLAATPRGSVMIHCGFGVSRSPTIAISYLMKRRGSTFADALAQVRKTRPSAQPNPGFVKQLQSLE
jgi:protein-tyrosine phosphatase